LLPITEQEIQLNVSVNTPEEAIAYTGSLLVAANKITQNYVDAMIDNFHTIGPYFVIAPHIAIPHARPENGVLEQCMSLVRLKEPIAFGHPHNDKVSLVIAIGGVDTDFHLEMLRDLSIFLSNQTTLNTIMTCSHASDITKLL